MTELTLTSIVIFNSHSAVEFKAGGHPVKLEFSDEERRTIIAMAEDVYERERIKLANAILEAKPKALPAPEVIEDAVYTDIIS